MEAVLTIVGFIAIGYAHVLFFKQKVTAAVQIVLLVAALFTVVNAIYSKYENLFQTGASVIMTFGLICLAVKVGEWMKAGESSTDSDLPG